MITKFDQAEKIINNGSADIVNIARKFIKNPTWLINTINEKNKDTEIFNPLNKRFK